MPDWIERPFGELAGVLRRGTAPTYVDVSPVRVIGQRCIRNEGFDASEARPHDPRVLAVVSPQAGDVLVNSTGTGTIGRSCVFREKHGEFVVDGHVTLVRPADSEADGRFLNELVRSPDGQRFLESHCFTGSTNQIELSCTQLAEMPVVVPPLEEQRRIAEILDTIDETIQATESVIAKLERVRSGLAHSLFGAIEAPSARLRDVASLTSGSTPSRSRDDYWNGSIPWVKTGEVRGNVIDGTEELITDRALSECPLDVYRVGTVLVAMYGQGTTRGRVAMLGVPATTNQACAAITSAPEVLDESYLFEFLKYSYDALRSLSHGSHQENLSTRLVGDFELPVPPLAEQTQVVTVLDSASARLTAEKADLEKLRRARAGLADDLLSGRVQAAVDA
ncbi:restriction endonuclease subunit S [Ilumatobacter sp.]|uniref:restriction endonuclease subunit S n=1 Tax=Ilumatobacter sp. TaxID=1967498 RepID=UPI003B52B2C8